MEHKNNQKKKKRTCRWGYFHEVILITKMRANLQFKFSGGLPYIIVDSLYFNLSFPRHGENIVVWKERNQVK